jgi:hypothetical protein
MIIFDQLRVSDDGKSFLVDVHVNTATYFDNVSISAVGIFRDTEISETDPVTKDNPKTDKCIFYQTYTTVKEVHLVLTLDSFKPFIVTNHLPDMSDLSHNIFYVYVFTTGEPVDAPCDTTGTPVLGVTYDTGKIYDNGMNFVRELADTCSIPSGFIDFILNKEALDIAIGTGHYIPAKDYFYRLLGYANMKGNVVSTKKPCGCHG